ncbi:MAG: YeeE/YedE thiosulfate transporter family protein [Candidatus Eisenbacteria bacterium]
MAPFNQLLHPHTLVYVAVFFAIGLAFGAVLEMSGFGDSRRLAAQFYLRDMTVLKVMFTAIIVAGVLIHLASSLELLDIRRIWINPTYLASGIVGGLIMGVGFILGGFCPGTSLVAAATLKLDGIFFVLGALVGVFAFGRTVPEFEPFFHAGFLGRYTIGDWLGVPIGVALVLVVGLALAMFYGAEVSEAVFGRRRSWRTVSLFPKSRALASGVVALGLVSAAVVLLGQPGTSDRWDWISRKGGDQLASRSVFVDPREVVDLRRDLSVRVRILDLRDETDYNLFHIDGAELADPETVDLPPLLANLLAVPDNTVIFLASNGEAVAREAWKRLRAQGVINLYVIEGGINHWLDVYPPTSIATRWSPSGRFRIRAAGG